MKAVLIIILLTGCVVADSPNFPDASSAPETDAFVRTPPIVCQGTYTASGSYIVACRASCTWSDVGVFGDVVTTTGDSGPPDHRPRISVERVGGDATWVVTHCLLNTQ
jgi:hypothetical protein